jgi:hypothetical protein
VCLAAPRPGKGQAIGAAVDRFQLFALVVLVLCAIHSLFVLCTLDCRLVLDAVANV